MTTLQVTLLIAAGAAGILVGRLWDRLTGAGTGLPAAQNRELPAGLEGIDPNRLMELYQKEWQTVIQTQMHFNDLIIRFRAMTLTAFAALVGATITLGRLMNLPETEGRILLALPIVFWIAAGALDLGYYHRLLLGAVGQAAKFDGSAVFQRLGLFGLTAAVTESIRPRWSYALVILYYLVPLLIIGAIVVTEIS